MNDETFDVRSFNNLNFPATCCCNCLRHFRSLISGVGEDICYKRKVASRIFEQSFCAISILYIGWQDAYIERETERVEKDKTFAARDLLAGVETLRINRRAPF